MPLHRVTDPQGIVHLVNAPEGATPEQIVAYAKQMAGSAPAGAPSVTPSPVVPGNEGVVFKDGSSPPARFGDFLKPVFGDHNPIAETYDAFVDPLVPDGGGRTPEEQAWLKQRSIGERAGDAAAFALSLPVRALSGGGSGHDQFGLGEGLKRLGAPELGDALSQKEANFAAANRPQLEAVQKAGEAAIGLPLHMGIPEAQLPKPRMPNGVVPKIVEKPIPYVPKPSSNAIRAGNRAADVHAMESLNIEPFGPALSGTGSGALIKSLSEVPIVGGPLKSKLEDVVGQARNAAEKIASQYGDAKTPDRAGQAIQEGLARVAEDKPSAFFDEKIANVPHAELQAVLKAPTNKSSIPIKAAALFEDAWRTIPQELVGNEKVLMTKGKAIKGQARLTGGMTETKTVLQTIVDRNMAMMKKGGTPEEAAARYDLAMPVRGGMPGQIVKDVLETSNMNRTIAAMRLIRSHFRRLASGIADTEKNTLNIADHEAIRHAITRDITNRLGTYAADYRARAGAAKTALEKQELLQKAAASQRSIDKFRRADRYYALQQQALERVKPIADNKNPTAAYARLAAAAKGGAKGDIGLMKDVRRLVRPDEWKQHAAATIHEMGAPKPSARGVVEDQQFSVQTFATNWNAMSPQAKSALFNHHAGKPLVSDLNHLARASDRLANFEALTNTSRTFSNQLAVGSAMAGAYGLVYHWQAALLTAGGVYAMSHFLSSRVYVKWLTRAAELESKGATPGAWRLHIQKLVGLAKHDGELGAAILRAVALMEHDPQPAIPQQQAKQLEYRGQP